MSLLPSLRRLRTQYGPNVVLKLDSFPSLVNVDLAMYYVDRNKDGSLPDGLQKLRLEYVCGFEGQRMEDESAWFKPSLFGSLMSFVLVDMTTATCAYVEGAVKVRFRRRFLVGFPRLTCSITPFSSFSYSINTDLRRFRRYLAAHSPIYLPDRRSVDRHRSFRSRRHPRLSPLRLRLAQVGSVP